MFKKIKSYFKKDIYKEAFLKTKWELDAVMSLLGKWNEWEDYFDIYSYLDKKIDWNINKNINFIFKDKNRSYSEIGKVVSEKIEDYFKIHIEKHEEQMKKNIDANMIKLNQSYLIDSKAFTVFLYKYLEENKYEIHKKLNEIVNSREFLENFSWEIEDHLRDKAIEVLNSNF